MLSFNWSADLIAWAIINAVQPFLWTNVELWQGRKVGLQAKGSSSKGQGTYNQAEIFSGMADIISISQYIDPIIAATWSDDGAVHDVCKALSPRIREPNAIVRTPISSSGILWTISLFTGRVQSLDCASHYDTEWLHGQRSLISLIIWSSTPTEYDCGELGWWLNSLSLILWGLIPSSR